MAMISASDFRNGVTFEMDGKVMQVVEFQHVKPGKGAAFVRTKMKNIITGGVTETSFNYLFACILASMATGLPEEFFTGLPLREVLKLKNAVNDADFFE